MLLKLVKILKSNIRIWSYNQWVEMRQEKKTLNSSFTRTKMTNQTECICFIYIESFCIFHVIR